MFSAEEDLTGANRRRKKEREVRDLPYPKQKMKIYIQNSYVRLSSFSFAFKRKLYHARISPPISTMKVEIETFKQIDRRRKRRKGWKRRRRSN